MDNAMQSPFQMSFYTTRSFRLRNTSFEQFSSDQIHHTLSSAYGAVFVEDRWHGIIVFTYAACDKAKDGEENANHFLVEISMQAAFTYQAANTDEERDRFVRLLKLNGAFSLFSTMRGIVASSTTALGISPGLVVPSVNLNALSWNEIPEPSIQ